MVKDLRTSAVQLKMHKYPSLDASPWGLKNPQPFFPPLETLFKTETVSSLKDYGIRLNEEIDKVLDANTIKTTKGNIVPIHRKTTMILSPFKWMRGDYGDLGLPKPESVAKEMKEKLQSPHTAGYVGALTSIVLSESGCVHFPKVYGVYVGNASNHTVDISDDYEELSERKWFIDNLGKTFELKLRNPEGGIEFQHTRTQRPGVVLGDDTRLDDFEELEADHISNPSSRSHTPSQISESVSSLVDEEEEDSQDDDVFEIESCDCASDASSDEGGDDTEPYAWATFHDVPVITTVMEPCEGTFYDLVTEHPEPLKHAAWVAQIVMALAYAQRIYAFTHNDLHGNNVMYVKTDQEFLYYKHSGTCYKIPTFGYILKLIDFDRAITSVRLIGMKDPRQFVSNQFHPEEEAAGQYNIEPFLDMKYPHIPPNPSFDLCRFATSMFWDMFPEGPDYPEYSLHPIFEVFKHWMKQTDNTSVMFRKQKDNHDRYHGFHLYKAIGRYCKDAVPRREINRLLAFQCPSIPLGAPCLFLEA